ncbi:MAG: FAD-dependent oxidoreductase [Actinomycetota bacterium]
MTHTIVLGAGLAGLAAARELVASGRTVTVIDKGRGIGGRLATRRIGHAVLDHGAQFFTTRGERFVALTAEAIEAGVVEEWCRGFGEPDGYPRYRGSAGMTSLARWMGRDLDVRLAAEANGIAVDDDAVRFVDAGGAVLAEGDDAIVTAPIPQMIALFDKGDVKLGHEVAHALKSTEYFATLALLVVVDGQPNVDDPGGMQLDAGPFTFVAENQRKGISPVQAITFHAEHDYSKRRFDDDVDEVHAELLQMAQPWIGDANVVESQLKKWRYAGPVTPIPERTLVVASSGRRIALAGDAFGGPKVEGAFNSGLAAAAALL